MSDVILDEVNKLFELADSVEELGDNKYYTAREHAQDIRRHAEHLQFAVRADRQERQARAEHEDALSYLMVTNAWKRAEKLSAVMMQVCRELQYVADKFEESQAIGDPCPRLSFGYEDFWNLKEMVEGVLTPEELAKADHLGPPTKKGEKE